MLVMPRLACPSWRWDDDQRHAFVGHLDRVSMPQLVGSEPPSHARGGRGMVQLLARD